MKCFICLFQQQQQRKKDAGRCGRATYVVAAARQFALGPVRGGRAVDARTRATATSWGIRAPPPGRHYFRPQVLRSHPDQTKARRHHVSYTTTNLLTYWYVIYSYPVKQLFNVYHPGLDIVFKRTAQLGNLRKHVSTSLSRTRPPFLELLLCLRSLVTAQISKLASPSLSRTLARGLCNPPIVLPYFFLPQSRLECIQNRLDWKGPRLMPIQLFHSKKTHECSHIEHCFTFLV